LTAFKEASRLAPNNAGTLTRIGYALIELGEMEAAEASFRAAIAAAHEDAQYSEATSNSHISTPLIGLAGLELSRNRPEQAAATAQRAIASAPKRAEAHIVLGLALMRQPGKLAEAAQALENATTAEPDEYHYQAYAWLALVRLSQDDREAALREAQRAVELAPASGLAHGNLSLVYFFSGNSREAEREARLAVELNPESVAARVALGQALLAQGDVDAADEAAAQAVALDPSLPQAHYLLGVANASRRDYRHAARELQEALKLAPDFLPAASTLARVYNAQGRPNEAVATLTALLPRHRSGDSVLGALGEVYYEQGRYDLSEQQYREAIKQRPNSGLYNAELARTLLYSNRLNAAIIAGQNAVRLAPEVGQYHALLGLAYDFRGLTSLAER
jgi:tetratricopeptide (TPR) repeat protein